MLIKNKHFSETLLQHIEEFISQQFIAVIDRLAEVANVENLKQSVHVACELRESILASCNNSYAETKGTSSSYDMQSQQAHLAHQLQSALMALQVLTLECATELASSIGDQMLHRVDEVACLLCEDLAAVVSAKQVAVLLADTAKQTEQTTVKKSDITDMSTEQTEKLTVCDETVTVQKGFEQKTSIESTSTIAQSPSKTMVNESTGISTAETGVEVSDEIVVSIEQETLSESKSEFDVDDNVDNAAGVVNTDVMSAKYALCEISEHLADSENVIKLDVEVKTKAAVDHEADMLSRSAPFTGNFVLIYYMTFIPI